MEARKKETGNGQISPVKAALQLPEGDVLVRKVRGPDGTHDWLGYVKRGRVYCLSADRAAALCAPGGEFEVLEDWAGDLAAARSPAGGGE